jgi:hypothetical protein
LASSLLLVPFVTHVPRADAVSTSMARNVHYVAAMQTLFGMGLPFSGTLVLNYNHGIVSGTYTDQSIQPGAPFANRPPVAVSGGVDGDNIHLNIGGSFNFNGKLEGDTISGSAFYRGKIVQFLAREGTPAKH